MKKDFENDVKTTLHQKNVIILPLIALVFDFMPIFFMLLSSVFYSISSYILLIVVLSPVVGLSLGIVSLVRRQLKGVGLVVAIVAVTIPAIYIAFIAFIFVGVTTGLISVM